jgi:sugar/nucleoside kinase (ribokinase family)
MSDRYDVVGIGNAIVDVISHGDDSFLENMGITKGIMQLVERERAELLYAAMSDRVQTAGGSVANTIAGVGSLGLSTAFLGKVKDDALGRFYAKGMAEQGTAFSQPAGVGGPAAHLAVDDLRLARWRTVDEHLSRRRCGFRRG